MKIWEVDYRNHRIRIENSLRGERLFVDDELQDEQPGLASRSRLYGVIRTGDGAGEQIKISLGGWFTIHCRIFVDHKLLVP